MRCRNCKEKIGLRDRTCPHCGAGQSLLGPERKGAASLLERVADAIEAESVLAEKALVGSGVGLATGGALAWPMGRMARPAVHRLVGGMGFAPEADPAEIQQIGQFVFYSPHVQSNKLYKLRADQTTLVFLAEADEVNAFATDHAIQGFDAQPPLIVFFGGLARAARVAALSLANDFDQQAASQSFGKPLITTIQRLGECIIGCSGALPCDAAHKIMSQPVSSDALRRARSYCAAMYLSVIAHELGHIALGHTLGETQTSNEVSRNQEREADSFAASVVSGSPFSDHTVTGGIFWWVIMTWVEAAAGGGSDDSTHPQAKERLMDYIRANRDQAASLGWTSEFIELLLP